MKIRLLNFRFLKKKKISKNRLSSFSNITDYIKKKYIAFQVKKHLIQQYKYKFFAEKFYTTNVRFFCFFVTKAFLALKKNKAEYFFDLAQNFYFNKILVILPYLEFNFNFEQFLMQKTRELCEKSFIARNKFKLILQRKKQTLFFIFFFKKKASRKMKLKRLNYKKALAYYFRLEKLLLIKKLKRKPKNLSLKEKTELKQKHDSLQRKFFALHFKLKRNKLNETELHNANLFLSKLIGINQRHGLRKKMIKNIFSGLSHFRKKHKLKTVSSTYIIASLLNKLNPKYKLGRFNISRRKSILIPHVLPEDKILINKARLISKALKRRSERSFALKFSAELSDIFFNKGISQKMQKETFNLVQQNKHNVKYLYPKQNILQTKK